MAKYVVTFRLRGYGNEVVAARHNSRKAAMETLRKARKHYARHPITLYSVYKRVC